MRLALIPLNPTVGALEANVRLAREALDRAKAAGADLAVLPELVVCAYPPRDLLLAPHFVEACERAAHDLALHAPAGLTVVVGTPRRQPAGGVANALLAARDGRLLCTYDKRLLPTYDVFDEDRYFSPGSSPGLIDVPHAGGTCRVGLAICEDLWKGEDAGFASRYAHAPDPVADLAHAGAALIVSPSASPFVLGKHRAHRALCAAHARRWGVPVASVNQAGANDDLVFDGHAMLLGAEGVLRAESPLFAEAVLVADVPVSGAAASNTLASPAPEPTPEPDEADLLFHALVTGVRDYVRKTGHRRVLLGLSGGIDSALTAAIAARALGPDRVVGVALPGVYSSTHSREDAADLADRLGLRLVTLPIDPAVQGVRSALDPALRALDQPALGATLPDLAEENVQSRVRGLLLMALSNRTGALVLTTGNKSELAVGYCTLYGDMNGGLAVLSDLTKQQVYRLARRLNDAWKPLGFAQPPIPRRSIDKPPSAELRPGQTDQDSLPPYDVLDEIVVRYVERREPARDIARSLGADPALVRSITAMIDRAEFKRRQAAPGLKVTSVAFGMGRRFPIAQAYTPE